jgi:hypothetical protein
MTKRSLERLPFMANVDLDRAYARVETELKRLWREATGKPGFYGKIGFELEVNDSKPGFLELRLNPKIKLTS